MRTKLFFVASLLLIASMVLGACAQPAVQTVVVEKEGEKVVTVVTATPEPKKVVEFKSKDPSTFVQATFGEPETFDPALLYETAGGSIVFNVYDTLIFYNHEDPVNFVPQLAMEVPSLENGGISADGLTYTWKIRPGVKFHDGTDMTPSDVAYSFQHGLLQGGTSSPQWLLTEPFFGSGVDDIAAVVGGKITGRVDAKAAELAAALDLAALTPEAVTQMFTDLAAYYTAQSGFAVDAATIDPAVVDTLITDVGALATDQEKFDKIAATASETIYGLEGGDVSALYDNVEGMGAVNPEILVEVAEMVKAAIVADDANMTVTMQLAVPWGPFLATLANSWGSVQSKAWVIANGGWDGDSATWQNFYAKTSDQLNELGLGTKAMGTGPYILDHWTQGEEIVLVANENYWRTEPAYEGGPTGAPAIKKIIIKSVDEFSTRFAMLQAGDADNIALGSSADWPQMDTLVGETCEGWLAENCQPSDTPDAALMRVKGLPSTARTDIFFTFQINAQGNTFIGSGQVDGNGIPPDFFSDIHVRRAFAYSFNYDQYFLDVMQSEAQRSNNIMLPGMLGYQEDSPIYTQDLAKSEEEFKASTWASADGKSLWDTGFRMTISYNTGNTARQTAAQIFQNELGSLNENFIIEVTGLPWPTFLKNQRASNLPIFISGWQEDIHDPHNWVVPYTTGTYGGRQKMPAELKAQFGEINARGAMESDPAKRAAIYAEFNKLFYDELPTIPMFVGFGRRYQQRWVKNWFGNTIFPGTYYYGMSKE